MKQSSGLNTFPSEDLSEGWRSGGFGLYVHWPYCLSKCPYCDFNSHVAASVDQSLWVSRYIEDIERFGRETGGRLLNSVYFGGGTPSLMSGSTVHRIMDTIRTTWRLANDCEITLEANPGAVDAARFTSYRDAGIERLSIGVQALNDKSLRQLGRLHDAGEALAAIDLARSVFSRVSFDLIYARQGQSLEEWERELEQALAMKPDHLSLYQLTIEEGTVFAQRQARGHLRDLPDEGMSVDMFNLTQQICAEAGLPAYEVSNHAKPGQESRHNLIYWTGGDYVGIGPGAHGRLTLGQNRWATETVKDPGKWLAGSAESPIEQRHCLSREEQALEYLMMGLRVTSGLSLARLTSMDPKALSTTGLDEMRELGMIRVSPDGLSTTPKGRLLLNQVIRKLLDF